ncbi:ABC transporter ATP-binding protein [Streptococcus halichoeri]|uniref:ABC transporter ATP-binding protein n=1 Tax=Streptococcus halichoeri TaxID=254785 RepID=UPI00135B30C6|nr:ABC transporter ATP-binding protein [Streptococcus halichoeri]
MGKNIRLSALYKAYGTTAVLKNINLKIEAGERLVLLGPSGSGKSTLLRMIAGLESITSGELYMGGKLANHLECGERNVAMVFQNYALYPHMTVGENISFALKANKVKKEVIQERLTEALDILELSPYKDRYPKELSGGQRQRVALARAIVKKSDYFLLDEPLSNLDVRLRLDARKELVKLHEKYRQTFIYVTHDQMEAMTLADRIVVLNNGAIQMVDKPEMVYARPANLFTATFIGSPGMSILKGQQEKGNLYINDNEQKVGLSRAWSRHLVDKEYMYVGIRPEHLHLDKGGGILKGTIKYSELLGQHFAYTVTIGQEDIIVLHDSKAFTIGEQVGINFSQDKLHFFDAETTLNLGYPEEV